MPLRTRAQTLVDRDQRSRLPNVNYGHSWWRAWSWVALGAILLVSYGLATHYGNGTLGRRLVDALKLFPQFPGLEPRRRWEYIVARQLAAIALLIATLGVVYALLAERVSEFRARFRSGHAVVCGLGETGLRDTLAFRSRGVRTTCIELNAKGDAVDLARASGALVLRRDATQISSLQNARVERAEHVVCSCADDATNTKIASLVASLASETADINRVTKIHVQIDNAHLAHVLRAPLASVGGARVSFFNMSNVWARALLDETPNHVELFSDRQSQILVVGTTSLGKAIIVEAARRWHGSDPSTSHAGRRSIVLVGPNAPDVTAKLVKRYPALTRVCRLEAMVDALEPGDPVEIPDFEALRAAYVCLDDESVNLALAVELERVLPGATPVLLTASPTAEALFPIFAGNSHLHAVTLSSEGTSLDLLHDQTTEIIAQAAHESYLRQRRTQPKFGDEPAHRSWADLSEDDRVDSRKHGERIVEQLRAVWYEIEPLYDWDEPPIELPALDVEAMAELEHLRWMAVRLSEKWRPGRESIRDEQRHSMLKPWTELEDDAREIDRAMVRARPAMLARVGFRLVRDPKREQLARELHERYETRPKQAQAVNAVPWDQLPEELRESNRAAIDHIAVKLARCGYRVVPRGVGAATRASFTTDEVEQMAMLEHERWIQEKRSAWKPEADGVRAEQTLLDWEDLEDSEREKDRAVVRAIPDQLASVDFEVVRDGSIESLQLPPGLDRGQSNASVARES